MKNCILFLIFTSCLLAQNPPKFPASVATNQDLSIARNGSVSTLTSSINNSTTTVPVADGTQFPVTSLITVGTEYMQVTAVIGNTLTVTRAFDGSPAASHTSGDSVFGYFLAYHHNQSIAEIRAIETFLGINGTNLNVPFSQITNGTSGGALSVAGSLFPSGSGTVDANKLQGRPFSSPAPTDTQVICWDNPNFTWKPCTASGGPGSGITTLNGLTSAVQSFASGTAGNDFVISSSGATHFFNLPSASASARGALTSADWTTFNNKQTALGFTPVPNTRVINATTPITITNSGVLNADLTIACPSCATGSGIQVNVTQAPYSATGNGVTDDTAAIQSAITAAGTNGFVYFPKGTYLVQTLGGGTITPIFDLTSNGLTLFGDGIGKTIIKRKPITTTPGNFQGAVLQLTGDYIEVRDMTIDQGWNGQGGGTNIRNPNWGGIRIGANGTTPTGNYAYIHHTETKNSGWLSMSLYNGIGAIISDNIITGLNLSNNYGIDGFWADKYANQWVLKNNIITDNCETGILFTAQDALVADNIVARNHLNNGTCEPGDPFPGGQVFLKNMQPNFAPQTTNPYYGRGIIIRGNHITDGPGGASGLEIGYGPGTTLSLVDGPIVEGNYIGWNANWGIAIQGGNQVMIRNNKIEHNGADGLFLDPGTKNVSIIANDIGFNGFYGLKISVGAVNNYILADNTLHDNTSGDYLNQGTGTNILVSGNLSPTTTIDNQYNQNLTCVTSAASTCNLGTTSHEWLNGRIFHLIGRDFDLTSVGGDLTSFLTSASTFGSFLKLGPLNTWAELNANSSGDFLLNHTSVATGVFQSKRSGAVASTLVLDQGKTLLNGASGSEGFTLGVKGTVGIFNVGGTSTLEVKTDFAAATVRTYSSAGNNPVFQGQSADNNVTSPTNVKSGQPLVVLAGKGYDGTSFPASSQAALVMTASQDQSNVAHGSYITFNTTPDGSLTRSTRLTVDHNGNIIVGPSRTPGANGGLRYSSGALQWSSDLTTWNTFTTGSTVCGSNQQLQFNNSGSCGASAALFWDGTFLYSNTLRLRGNDTNAIYESNPATFLNISTHSGSIFLSPSTTPALTLATSGDATFAANITAGPLAEVKQSFGAATFRAFATSGNNAVFQGQVADNSIASPTNVKNTQPLVVVAGKGYDGSVYPSSSQAAFIMRAAEDQTATHHGSYMEFATTPNLSVTRAVRFTIANDGTIILGPSQTAGNNAGLRYNSGTNKLEYSHDLTTWTALP